ncbi:hypothetical protein ACFYSJ_36535 [Streptomyces sp. NPDC005248]|uniref:hypothetical protein n=1 Tax=unclassified Streptomyces TaxID=2593676 RepID=UPI002E120EAF|nr:hypothetical protein OG763_42750 [Streptomyces sp. NBC_01230]
MPAARVWRGEVVSPDGVQPLRQPFALALGEHLTERPDVAGESIEFAAVDRVPAIRRSMLAVLVV